MSRVSSEQPSEESRLEHRRRGSRYGLICSLCLSETYDLRVRHVSENASSHSSGIGSGGHSPAYVHLRFHPDGDQLAKSSALNQSVRRRKLKSGCRSGRASWPRQEFVRSQSVSTTGQLQ